MHTPSWLAIETSTDLLSLAVARGDQSWTHTSAGGAKSSQQILPSIQALLSEAGLSLPALQAVVLGRGPGAFTGLRTACSVAQGLTFGAVLPVLPIDTLLAVAEDVRHAQAMEAQAPVNRVLVVMDARMAQVYTAAYEYAEDGPKSGWHCVQANQVHNPEHLQWPSDWPADGFVAAGNAWNMDAAHWPAALTARRLHAMPTAAALLRLAPQAWAQGLAVPPEDALPLYIRDNVAQTTDQRMQAKQAAASQTA
jgi:tRNA threonylcarbamoyladenosine biosynthesis protein TsaB